jgi:hypothetical protein
VIPVLARENSMNIQRLAAVLTVVNFVLLAFQLTQMHPATAQSVVPVLRGRSLEIVDEQGKVRAFLGVLAANPSGAPRAEGALPETVILRLMDPRTGRPSAKFSTSEKGSGLSLAGQSGTRETYVSLNADSTGSSLKLKNEDGREHVLKP